MEKRFSLDENCVRISASAAYDFSSFTCGDEELDHFFAHEASLYADQLLGKTYYFVTIEEHPKIVAAFTVANDSIKAALVSNSLRNKVQRKIPNSKRTRSYPAVLIARLGVSIDMKGLQIGAQVIDYIKSWFSRSDNKSGCRFVVVDAYNRPEVLRFYEKNDFKYLYASEDEEKTVFSISSSKNLNSRIMYFDLIETR